MTDVEKIDVLQRLGVTVTISGDVMTLSFKTGATEDWLAVSPPLLSLDAWQGFDAFELAGRTWVRCEGATT